MFKMKREFFTAVMVAFVQLFQQCFSALASSSTSSSESNSASDKRIVFIRHGCTFANEYLAQPGTGWGDPTFQDVPDLRDSPLSPLGVRQATQLRQKVKDGNFPVALENIDLVVVSPLSRTLQTFELGVWPEMEKRKLNPPVVALPYARERLYMISDMGLTTDELKVKFPWVDFDSQFDKSTSKEWWYTSENGWEDYDEWRPHGNGQKYLVPGEPDNEFEARMFDLVKWLGARPEKNIILVCHWGVLEFLTGDDFDNCEVRALNYEKLEAIKKNPLNASSV